MKKKYVLNIYSMFDTHVLANKLEKMARKGWHFKEIIPKFLVFEEGVPAESHYSTAFFPNTSLFEPSPTEDHESYLDLCARQGWELVWTLGSRQIFRNDRPDPVPIETDNAIHLQNIGGSMGRYLLHNFLSILLCIPFLLLIHQENRLYEIGYAEHWTKSEVIFPMACLVFANAALGLLKCLWYFIWFFWSSSRVEKGRSFAPTLFGVRTGLNILLSIYAFYVLSSFMSPIFILLTVVFCYPVDLFAWRLFMGSKKFFRTKEQVYLFMVSTNLLLTRLAEYIAARLPL